MSRNINDQSHARLVPSCLLGVCLVRAARWDSCAAYMGYVYAWSLGVAVTRRTQGMSRSTCRLAVLAGRLCHNSMACHGCRLIIVICPRPRQETESVMESMGGRYGMNPSSRHHHT